MPEPAPLRLVGAPGPAPGTQPGGGERVKRWLLQMVQAETVGAMRPATAAVLLAIAGHANEHRESWASRQTLAREVKKSEATVKRATAELLAMGVIERLRPGSGRTTARYRLADPAGRKPTPTDTPSPGGSRAPPQGGHQRPPWGVTGAPPGGSPAPPITTKEEMGKKNDVPDVAVESRLFESVDAVELLVGSANFQPGDARGLVDEFTPARVRQAVEHATYLERMDGLRKGKRATIVWILRKDIPMDDRMERDKQRQAAQRRQNEQRRADDARSDRDVQDELVEFARISAPERSELLVQIAADESVMHAIREKIPTVSAANPGPMLRGMMLVRKRKNDAAAAAQKADPS